MIEFSIPALGPGSSQVLTLASNTSTVFANPIVPVAPAGTLVPQIGKAMVSISGGGATNQQFHHVFYAVGQAPVANATTCPALIGGGVYLIEGFAPGDKLALYSNGAATVASVTRVA